ncbi:unnamed protein product [Alopecurus aequalis]
MLDLNLIPEEANDDPDHERANDDPDHEEANDDPDHEEANDDPDHEEANVEHSTKRNLKDKEKHGIYFALYVIKMRDGKVLPEDKQLVACLLNTSVRTVERIWEDANIQMQKGEEVDVSSKMKGRVGRKRKDLDLPRMTTIPLNKRRTIRSLAKHLGVDRSTLHRRFLLGEMTRHSSAVKPVMTPENKIKRVKFCVSMVDPRTLTLPNPFFLIMDKFVHMDEKWFYLTRENNTYYLHAGEHPPLRSIRNKNFIGKVMFLTAVAKPRYGPGGVVTFDGKIGIWPFVTETPAKQKSKNIDKGGLELKSMKVNRQVMRDYLCGKVIPAIQDLWPDEDLKSTIFIQQDNAKPHVLDSDPAFRDAVSQTDLDIRLLQQSPNNLDMNVLNLCFFPSLQSLTDTRAPKNIRELIEGVQEEFQNYEVDKLARSFVTLQSCMREIMRDGGGNGYSIPHLKKELQQKEGRLPIALHITAQQLQESMALIEAGTETA